MRLFSHRDAQKTRRHQVQGEDSRRRQCLRQSEFTQRLLASDGARNQRYAADFAAMMRLLQGTGRTTGSSRPASATRIFLPRSPPAHVHQPENLLP